MKKKNQPATRNKGSVPGNLYFQRFSFYSVSLGSVTDFTLWWWCIFVFLWDMPMIVDTESSVFSAPGLPDETLFSSPHRTTSELTGNVGPLLITPTERERNLWHHVLLDRMTPPDSAPNLPHLFFTQLQPSLCNKRVLFRPLVMPQKRIIFCF